MSGTTAPVILAPLPWRSTPLMRASYAVHAGAALAAVAWPQYWGAALAAVVADHALLTAAGLLPRCSLLGPNWTRLPAAAAARGEVAITIDDGPDPAVTPAVLDLLGRHRAPATFFCIGTQAAAHPALVREIVDRGHAIENHSQHHHHNFSLLGPRGFAAEIEAGQATLAAFAGSTPRFFRAPAGLRNPFLGPVLARHGLHLASWTRRAFDTRCGDADEVMRRLLRNLAPGDILLLHDRHAARTPAGVPVILEVLPRLLDALAAADLRPVTLRAALA